MRACVAEQQKHPPDHCRLPIANLRLPIGFERQCLSLSEVRINALLINRDQSAIGGNERREISIGNRQSEIGNVFAGWCNRQHVGL